MRPFGRHSFPVSRSQFRGKVALKIAVTKTSFAFPCGSVCSLAVFKSTFDAFAPHGVESCPSQWVLGYLACWQ